MRKIFHRLLPLEEAMKILDGLTELKHRRIERVSLLEALGRILATDIYAKIDYPPFDRSEVDGYAVRAEDTYGASDVNPVRLRVAGSIEIGEEPKQEVTSGTAIEIATGAPVPRGSNAVVMEEYVHREDPYIEVYKSVAPLENIAIAGSDISLGELVIPKGTRLGAFELGVLAALGYDSVEVYVRPRVAVISVGNELEPPGRELRYGHLYDYNGFMLTAYLRSLGAEARYLGIGPDNEDKLKEMIIGCIGEYDVVVTSGGTSAGIGDIVYRVVESVGEVVIHGLEVKPGKPTLVGVVRGKLVVGLPGFPFSAVIGALTLLRYIVEKLSGIESPSGGLSIKARIAQRIRKEAGKDLYIPVTIVNRGSSFIAVPIPYRSGSISSILKANGVAVVRRGIEIVDEGGEVEVTLLSLEVPEAVFIGSHDMALPLALRVSGLMPKLRFIPVGSLTGLVSVAKGYGDVAPIHLLDPNTNTYNITYVEQYNDVVLVSGYRRRLVLAFQRGNPKNIKGFEDFLRNDIRIVNRNRGSGTRTYIEMVLSALAKKMGIEFDELVQRVNGYTYEVSSHTGVAAAIAHGRADVGVCIEYAAVLYNLDYRPLTWEDYDFAVHRQSLTKPAIVKFIEMLKSERVNEVIRSLPGYATKDNTGEIIHS